MENQDSTSVKKETAANDTKDSQALRTEMKTFLKIYEERNRNLDEKFGRVYTISALLYLLIGMVLVIAGYTVRSFLGVFVLIPIGLSFFVACICQYFAAKKFFDE